MADGWLTGKKAHVRSAIRHSDKYRLSTLTSVLSLYLSLCVAILIYKATPYAGAHLRHLNARCELVSMRVLHSLTPFATCVQCVCLVGLCLSVLGGGGLRQADDRHSMKHKNSNQSVHQEQREQNQSIEMTKTI